MSPLEPPPSARLHLCIQRAPVRIMCGVDRMAQTRTVRMTVDREAVTCANCLKSMRMAGPRLAFVDGVKV